MHEVTHSLSLLSVRNAIAELELSKGLEKVKSVCGAYIWEVKKHYPVGDRYHTRIYGSAITEGTAWINVAGSFIPGTTFLD